MRFATTMLAMVLVLASTQLSAAGTTPAAAPISKHQLSDCMLKRMTSNRMLSYNDAAKACKDELRGEKTDAALSSSTPKPVS